MKARKASFAHELVRCAMRGEWQLVTAGSEEPFHSQRAARRAAQVVMQKFFYEIFSR